MRALRNFLLNGSLVVASIIVFLVFCEVVLFRLIWLASDAPRLAYVDDVVRYAPHQRGIWRVRNEIAAAFSINAQGWNSGSGDYVQERRVGRLRVAVIGDSFVDAMQVASSDSLAEVVQRTLDKNGQPAEVYRFGISGAPLSQYVHMAEREVVRYRPDWIVVNVVHNDFDESFSFVQGRYTSSFLKFRIEDGKVTGELAPLPWRSSFVETLRLTATARFFLYRWQVRPQAVIDFLLPRPAAASLGPWAANVDIGRVLESHREVSAAADHAVTRLAAITAGIGAKLLLVMDGDRNAIYHGEIGSRALALNRILADAAARHGIDFVDLHAVFAQHWAVHRRHFSFESDGHWNELGHAIVGAAIAERIRQAR